MVQFLSPVYHLPSKDMSIANWCIDKAERVFDFGQHRYRVIESKDHNISVINDTSSLIPSYLECACKVLLMPLSILLLPLKLFYRWNNEIKVVHLSNSEMQLSSDQIHKEAAKVKAVAQLHLKMNIDLHESEQINGKKALCDLADFASKKLLVDFEDEGVENICEISNSNAFKSKFYSSLPEVYSYLENKFYMLSDGENVSPDETKKVLSEFRSIFLGMFSLKSKSEKSDLMNKYKAYLVSIKDPQNIVDADNYPHNFFLREGEGKFSRREAKYLKGLTHLFTAYRKQAKLLSSKDPNILSLSPEMKDLLKLSIFHGSKTSTLRFMERTDLSIIPSGWLHELNARVVSGELDSGAQFNGVNRKGSSWAPEELIERALSYGELNKFRLIDKDSLINISLDHPNDETLKSFFKEQIHALRIAFINYNLWNGQDSDLNKHVRVLSDLLQNQLGVQNLKDSSKGPTIDEMSYIRGELSLLNKALDDPPKRLSDLERFYISNQRFILFASRYPLGAFSKGKVFDNEVIVRKAVCLKQDIHAVFVKTSRDRVNVNRYLEKHKLQGRVKVYCGNELSRMQKKFKELLPKFRDVFSLRKMQKLSKRS